MNEKENDENPSRNKKSAPIGTCIFFLSKIDQLINPNRVLSNTHSRSSEALPYSLHVLSS